MKCAKCGHEAFKNISPDIDISGIGFCQKHEELVMMAYMLLMHNKKNWDEATKGWWINQ